MPLLELKEIGKIYASSDTVAVGIRGVNLSFDKGEFVAITGKSGSGKSSLLNVISGMDTYEEGELFINGESTSHYLQPEWEEYRQKYISFIFQDYNIIESFTVLQNVELALLHIDDKKERRAKALQLLERVGLSDRLHQKGSKLSGGQKQRTVIARALAKDSPIILADEPTGNLDFKSSEEIIELLHEVSKDKLLIVVTHNFEQVQKYATRQIRIFDGSVEFDHAENSAALCDDGASKSRDVTTSDPIDSAGQGSVAAPNGGAAKKKDAVAAELKKGWALGTAIFRSTPKLTLFLCLLLIIGAIAIFLITSVCGDAMSLFEKSYMFEHIDGRLVVTYRSGQPINSEEAQAIADECNADSYLMYDMLLDGKSMNTYVKECGRYIDFVCTYGTDYGKNILGRYPQAPNEVLLYLPISFQPYFGKSEIKIDKIAIMTLALNVTGIKYFYDNNKSAKMLFTAEGFRTATDFYFLTYNADTSVKIYVNGADVKNGGYVDFIPSFDIPDGEIFIDDPDYYAKVKPNDSTSVVFDANYMDWDYSIDNYRIYDFTALFDESDLAASRPNEYRSLYEISGYGYNGVYMSTSVLHEIADSVLSKYYKQVSLFFGSDKRAAAAAKTLNDGDYIAVTSDTTYEPSAAEKLLQVIQGIFILCVWIGVVLFLAFFINICTRRIMDAFKSDMAIMRSMGIPVRTVKIGVYVRMILSLLPSYAFIAATAMLIYLTPKLNAYFVFLYAWQYVVIFLGMLFLTLRVTHLQIRRLFKESVKKSLKGGAK